VPDDAGARPAPSSRPELSAAAYPDRASWYVSYAGEYLEKARLPPGDLNLWTVAQLCMELTIDARLDTLDEPQINDLAPIRAEEQGRIKALLDGRQISG
jgi:hypothetical protein